MPGSSRKSGWSPVVITRLSLHYRPLRFGFRNSGQVEVSWGEQVLDSWGGILPVWQRRVLEFQAPGRRGSC